MENHAGYCLVLFSHPVPAFTFFRTIFISKKDLYNSRPWILQHEQVHARQLHTLDILLAELARIICWFNPLLGWYQREMKCVHEYIADAGIPEEEKGDYARLLYEYTLSHYKNPVIHSFYTKNILKRRIKMIHQKNPSKRNWLYYLLILPLTGGLLLMPGAGKVSPEELTEKLVPAEDNGRRIDISGRITDVSGQPVAGASVYVLETPKGTASDVKGNFTINRIPPDARLKVSRIGYQDVEIDVNKSRIINIKLSKSKERLPQEGLVIVGYSTKEDEPSAAPPAEKEPDESEVYTFASIEKRPEFEGGIRKFLEYVFKNTRYPAEARENNIQGEVEIGFTIDETGRVTDPEIIKGIGGGCDEELIRVMEDAPRWIPGEQNGVPVSVYYILPVNMELR